MRYTMEKAILLSWGLSILTACSSIFPNQYETSPSTSIRSNNVVTRKTIEGSTLDNTAVATEAPVGGNISRNMDSMDKTKLSHALDKALGKSTQWTNENTGITYTVVPTRKLTIGDNPFCRKYNVIATKDEKRREIQGTACVDSNSNWQSVSD